MALREVELVIQSSQVSAALTDFPVLIARSNLPNEVCDPSGSNNAQADGGDLKFYSDSALTTRLACVVRRFAHDSTTNAADAVIAVFVKVPSVSASANTSIYMTYNEPSVTSQPAVTDPAGRNAVWSDYAFVLPLNEATGWVDETGNGRDASLDAGTTPAQTTTGHPWGDNWLDFALDAVLVLASSNSAMDGTLATLSAWINADTVSTADGLVGNRHSSTDGNYYQHQTQAKFAGHDGTAEEKAESTRATASTILTHGTYEASTAVRLYDNGAEIASNVAVTTGSITGPAGNNYRLATYYDPSTDTARRYDGRLGEVRGRVSVLSADWISAEYNNQSSPSTFIVEGTPADSGGGTPTEYTQSVGGALTPAGTISSSVVFARTVLGALTPESSISKQTNKAVAGSATPTGAVSKETSKNVAGSVTPTGALTARLTLLQSVAGTLGMAGTLTTEWIAASVRSTYRRFTSLVSSMLNGRR